MKNFSYLFVFFALAMIWEGIEYGLPNKKKFQKVEDKRNNRNKFINGKIFFIEDGLLYSVQAKNGYILSYSKKKYDRDTNLICWEGYAYVQGSPVVFNNFIRYKSAFLHPVNYLFNFTVRYFNKNRTYSVFKSNIKNNYYNYDYEEIKYNKFGKIKKVLVHKNNTDSVFYFDKNGSLRKCIINDEIIKMPEESNNSALYRRFSKYDDLFLNSFIRMPFKKEPNISDCIMPDSSFYR